MAELKIVDQSHVIFWSLTFFNMCVMIFKSTIHLPKALRLVIFVALSVSQSVGRSVSQSVSFALTSTDPRASVH